MTEPVRPTVGGNPDAHVRGAAAEVPLAGVATAGPVVLADLERSLRRFTEEARRFSEAFTSGAGPTWPPSLSRRSGATTRIARSLFAKWVIDILLLLGDREGLGFQEMRRTLGGISPRVLSQKLRLLEQRGLVRRAVLATRPTRVRYSLTADGRVLAQLGQPVFLFLRYRSGHSPGARRRACPAPSPRADDGPGGPNGADPAPGGSGAAGPYAAAPYVP